MYPVLAQTYPATLRASGTGFVIGIGRGGSALGPVVAGALFAGGSSLLTVSLVMGLGGLVAAAMILMLRSEEHTSELQSLMRNSYAGFCLKKKTQPQSTVYTTC